MRPANPCEREKNEVFSKSLLRSLPADRQISNCTAAIIMQILHPPSGTTVGCLDEHVSSDATGLSNLKLLYRRYRFAFSAAVALQLVVYGYLFTSLIFTNHTFPNSWVFSYPSFKTRAEGRWFADMIIWVQGGSGVQPFQMALAVLLQTLNGMLYARLLGIHDRWSVFLATAFLCLYPAFLDYYSFSMDHLTFALGDTLAIAAILICRERSHTALNTSLSVGLFVLALASYQPKIALMALLCLCHLIARAASHSRTPAPHYTTDLLRETGYIAAVFVASVIAYWVSAKLTMSEGGSQRANLNSVATMLSAYLNSYRECADYYTRGTDYLPAILRLLPIAVIGVGAVVLTYRAMRRHLLAGIMVLIFISLMPAALRFSYILNSNSWGGAGRIVFAHAYGLLFFLGTMLSAVGLKKLTHGMLILFIYFFAIVGTQQSNAAALKTIYEVNMINRITARIEMAADDLDKQRYALVVVGKYPPFAQSRYSRFSNSGNRNQMQTPAFEAYRHKEILNFMIGRDALERPTPQQIDTAINSARGRRPWPSEESVYLRDGVIVVLLEEWGPNVSTTWAIPE